MAAVQPMKPTTSVEKIPVTIMVGKRLIPGSRQEIDGCWSIGRKFKAGAHDLEVTPEQLKELRRDEATGILSLTIIEKKQ